MEDARLLAEKLGSFSRRRPCLFSDGAFVRGDDDRDPGVHIAAGHCRTCDPSSAVMTLLGLDPSEPLDQSDLRRDLVLGSKRTVRFFSDPHLERPSLLLKLLLREAVLGGLG